jgi:enterochelin esterase-like enzyme
MHKEPFEKLPMALHQLEAARLSETEHLTIDRIRFWSDEMNEARFFLALVPKRPYSGAFILNHGWFDRPEDLLKHLHVEQVYDGLLARGEVQPRVLLIPDVRFSNFYRMRSSRFPYANYLTLVAEEVADAASRNYAVPFERQRWGIGGFSFGGYVSLDVGRRFPGRFGFVAVISGFSDPQWSLWPAAPVDPGRLDSKGRGKQTVVEAGPPPRLFLACGVNDRLFATMRLLHDRLTVEGFPHTWSTGTGGHTWTYWSSVLTPMLQFAFGSGAAEEGVR